MKHTVLVTGASRGIGAATASAFARAGHRVVIHYNTGKREAYALCETLRGEGCSVMTAQADVTSEEQVRSLCERVRKAYGFIDVLVNNAGAALPQMLLTDCGRQDWERVFAVNATGTFLVSRGVLPEMVSKKRGSIVNVASVWGMTGGSCEVAYSAAKAAVVGLTKALAKEAAPSGIRVNCVAPGFIQTDMTACFSEEARRAVCAETPLGRLGEPNDVAAAVLFFALEDASFITGQTLCVDGGMCI